MMESSFDVFVSYSHKDEVWVKTELLPRLESVGLKVCIDDRDFESGKSALLNMQDAILNSRYAILVITQHWLDSEWTLFEALLSRMNDPAGLRGRTKPLLLEKCELPLLLKMLTFIDLTNPEKYHQQWMKLERELLNSPVELDLNTIELGEVIEPTVVDSCLDWLYRNPSHTQWVELWYRLVEQDFKRQEIINLGEVWLDKYPKHIQWPYVIEKILKIIPKRDRGNVIRKGIQWLYNEYNNLQWGEVVNLLLQYDPANQELKKLKANNQMRRI